MAERDLGTLLTEAFELRAQELVPDTLPAPGFPAVERRHPRARWLAPLASAAAVVTAVAVGVSVARDGSRAHRSLAAGHSSVAIALQAMPDPAGVGLPVTAHFDRSFTDARALQAATTVTVSGKPLPARWYFVRSAGRITGLLRPHQFWPAHAHVTVRVAAAGASAGAGLSFGSGHTLTFRTGSADIATVDAKSRTLTLAVDGTVVRKVLVTLGERNFPTSRGVKVITAKTPHTCLKGPGYDECDIKHVQTVVPGREYLLGAPWAVFALGKLDISRGSTDLRPSDAAALYKLMRVGDVVSYPNASGPLVGVAENGWWSVPWSKWSSGGAVPTR